ncbi:MAG: helix-turn-helix transcriptional regulator [Sinimarinibacterium flocculans]|uniref:helix-turn-helix transcriptional regulator n=1 Tax=Sinimarinibacterium flocculans TaxID=985250 RepID=UPI003C3DE297
MRTTILEVTDGDDLRRDTILRYLAMAQIIPRQPSPPMTASRIFEALQERGYKCTLRTVQRDLLKLSDVFHYTEQTDGNALGWFYPTTTRLLTFPNMDPHCALALVAAQDYLRPLLPTATTELMRPYFSRAEAVLRDAVSERWASWLSRIQVLPPGPQQRPPPVKSAVQEAVYAAILKGQQLEIEYQAPDADKRSSLTLHPQGLVLREGVVYLVATAWAYDDVRHYALHRIRKAESRAAGGRILEGFDFASYVEREFRYPVGSTPLKLRLRVVAGSRIASHLQERPLSDDQTISTQGEACIASATVADTAELRWWLLSYGAQIEVLKPPSLRRELAATIAEMAARYSE